MQYRQYVERKLNDFDVYFVFDRYQDFSIKSATRANHGKSIKNGHICDDITSNVKFP